MIVCKSLNVCICATFYPIHSFTAMQPLILYFYLVLEMYVCLSIKLLDGCFTKIFPFTNL